MKFSSAAPKSNVGKDYISAGVSVKPATPAAAKPCVQHGALVASLAVAVMILISAGRSLGSVADLDGVLRSGTLRLQLRLGCWCGILCLLHRSRRLTGLDGKTHLESPLGPSSAGAKRNFSRLQGCAAVSSGKENCDQQKTGLAGSTRCLPRPGICQLPRITRIVSPGGSGQLPVNLKNVGRAEQGWKNPPLPRTEVSCEAAGVTVLVIIKTWRTPRLLTKVTIKNTIQENRSNEVPPASHRSPADGSPCDLLTVYKK